MISVRVMSPWSSRMTRKRHDAGGRRLQDSGEKFLVELQGSAEDDDEALAIACRGRHHQPLPQADANRLERAMDGIGRLPSQSAWS